jgi:diketogulonate reductase-like aldo/keto reductase
MSMRRALLQGMLAAGALAMSQSIRSQSSSASGLIRRAIPASKEELPVIGLGTYQAFDVGTEANARAALTEVLRTLTHKGGSVLDSSPMYGRAESVVGDLSTDAGLRPKLFLATKVWTSGKEAGIRQMEESFRLMRTQTMDLMQIHNLLDWRTHTATLKEWKRQGRVRYIGITHYHSGAYDDLERLIKRRDYDFVQLNYSIAEREAERSILPLARDTGVAVIANRPFAQSSLFSRVRGKQLPAWAAEFDCASWAQFFLKYIVSHPAVTCAIPATNKAQHMADNLGAAYGKLPDEQLRQRMAAIMDSL